MGNIDTGSDSSSYQGRRPNLKSGGGWERLVSEYLGDLPRQLDSVRAILEIPNYEKIAQQAHRIKGTAGTYGLEAISREAARLEESAQTHDRQDVAQALGRITESVEAQNSRLKRRSAGTAGKPERAIDA